MKQRQRVPSGIDVHWSVSKCISVSTRLLPLGLNEYTWHEAVFIVVVVVLSHILVAKIFRVRTIHIYYFINIAY
jgi:hypothetical protein